MLACPSRHEIEQTLLGLLPDDRLAVNQAHLLECAGCVETAHGLPATDTLVESLKVAPDVYSTMSSPTPEVRALIERFRLLALQPAPRAAATVDFDARLAGGSAAVAPPENAGLPVGTTLGNYLLLERIGAGGMGHVYKARHLRMDRIVAIKVLSPRVAKDEIAIARFEREAKAAAKLFHPNVVAALDADQADGIHFLVMEFIAGNDLAALVKKNGALPVDKAVDYVLQAARGLDFAHRSGLIHRDVKPSNMLLDGEGTVKILDLGLARIMSAVEGDRSPNADLTYSGMIMGTADYMAPEQALNTRLADARADIYALGCTLYYLISDQPIFAGDTFLEKLLAHSGRPVPSLCALRPEVTAQLDAVFQKMMAKKVAERYQTMAEVVTELQACVAALAPHKPNAELGAGFRQALEPFSLAKLGPENFATRKWLAAAGVICLLGAAIYVVGMKNNSDLPSAPVDRHSGPIGFQPPDTADIAQPAHAVEYEKPVVESETPANAESERLAAERLIGIGARLRLSTAQRTYDVDQPGQLPPEAFTIVHITLDNNSRVTKDDLAALPPLSSLENLNLTNTQAIDLSAFENDRKLENLTLYQAGVTNADLVHLRSMSGLKRLSLGGTGIDDTGLLNVAGLPQLVSLDLRNSHVSDHSVPVLAKLKNLANLVLSGTQVTAAGVAQLQGSLPQCVIEWDGATK